jgi:hypothetical protein
MCHLSGISHLIAALILTGPAMAQTCTSAPDRAQEFAVLIEKAQEAPDATAGLAALKPCLSERRLRPVPEAQEQDH